MKKVINVTIIFGIISLLFVAGVKAAISLSASNVTYNGTTVQAKLEELETKVKKCPEGALCSKVELGDYISMTPTQTTYTIPKAATGCSSDETINPNKLNLWRVINIRNDGTIEIVSQYILDGVTLCGKTGYLNLVNVLNTVARQFGNSKYTIDARHVGYRGQTAIITNTSKFTTTAAWYGSTSNNENEKLGGGDMMYEYDINLITKALGTTLAKDVGMNSNYHYWLASRVYTGYSSDIYWYGRCTGSTEGKISSRYLYRYSSDEGFVSLTNYGSDIRPILVLRTDITTFTGSGTSSSPWVLS